MASALEVTTNLPLFRDLLTEWTGSQPSPTGFVTPPGQVKDGVLKNVVVAFRTRPPLEGEAESKFRALVQEGEVETHETCLGITPKSAEPGVFVAHVPAKKWSGYTLAHKEYRADLAFGPDIANEEVYQRTVVANNIISLALSGGVGCVLAYGQTSSGKTYTMEGIESCISRDLFEAARAVGKRLSPDTDDENDLFEFSVTFLELLGKRATDLVDQAGADVAIQEDKVGNIRPRLLATNVRTSVELQELITSALAHRRVVATDRNAVSSRSHAVLNIRIKNKTLPYTEEGQLILVDLAGSERYEDSKGHDKQRMRESRENNDSLMNLKECVRAKAKAASEDGFVHIPWRSNKLTLLLKPLFDIESRQPSSAVIIAHVSPHIQDSIHSTNTLSYAAPFLTVPPKAKGPAPYNAKDPRTWSTTQTREFLEAQFGARQRKRNGLKPGDEVDIGLDIEKLCPEGYTAKNLGALYTTEFVERCLAAQTTKPSDTPRLKNHAVEVIGQLFYLVMTAKTQSRNKVMKTRKELSMDVYGELPKGSVEENPELSADNVMFQEAYEHFMETWHVELNAAQKTSRDRGESGREWYDQFVLGKVEAWKVIKAQRILEAAGSSETSPLNE